MTFHFEASGKLKILTEEELAQQEGDSAIIVYDEGTLDDSSPYWVYIAVKPSKYTEFIRRIERGETLTYNDYGTIIRFGLEESAPYEVVEEMQRDYECRDNFMDVFIERFKMAQTAVLQKVEDKRINDIVAMLKKKQASN